MIKYRLESLAFKDNHPPFFLKRLFFKNVFQISIYVHSLLTLSSFQGGLQAKARMKRGDRVKYFKISMRKT